MTLAILIESDDAIEAAKVLGDAIDAADGTMVPDAEAARLQAVERVFLRTCGALRTAGILPPSRG